MQYSRCLRHDKVKLILQYDTVSCQITIHKNRIIKSIKEKYFF